MAKAARAQRFDMHQIMEIHGEARIIKLRSEHLGTYRPTDHGLRKSSYGNLSPLEAENIPFSEALPKGIKGSGDNMFETPTRMFWFKGWKVEHKEGNTLVTTERPVSSRGKVTSLSFVGFTLNISACKNFFWPPSKRLGEKWPLSKGSRCVL